MVAPGKEISYKGPKGGILRGLTTIQQVLWICSVLAQVVLAARLWAIGARQYRTFIAYLVFATAGSVVLAAFPYHRQSYAEMWIAVQVPGIVLLYVSAFDMLNRLADDFGASDRPGRMARYARRVLTLLFAAALLLCAASTIIDSHTLSNRIGLASILAHANLLYRLATSVLALFLVLTAFYFSRYGAELRPNLRWHGFLFTIWTSMSAMQWLWLNLAVTADSIYVRNVAQLASTTLLFAAWSVLLTKRGEELPARPAVSERDGRRTHAEWEAVVAWLGRLRSQKS